VPVVVTEGLHHQISELLDKNRGLVVEQTAARATIHRLERDLAAWKGKVTGKEEEIGSMRYQMARLERQVEKMTGSMGGSERRVLEARQGNL
jgi:chromosome segregation ATPase